MSNTLKLAVLGDSVPWGQGLLSEHKYAYQVADKLCQSEAEDLCFLAHSGAVIGANGGNGQTASSSEIPVSCPTILSQVDETPNPTQYDLVILNGGINDVNIRVILNPFTKPSALGELITSACYRDMKALLSKAANAFKKLRCKFVVTGYYPILSPDSDLDLFDGVDSFGHLLGIYGLGFPLHLDQALVLRQVCALAMQFWQESNAAIARAVLESASVLNLNGRIKFVPCPFAEKNALFAKDPCLFGFNADLTPQDEVSEERANACGLHYSDPFETLDREICHYASVGHPNVEGAKRIAECVLNSI